MTEEARTVGTIENTQIRNIYSSLLEQTDCGYLTFRLSVAAYEVGGSASYLMRLGAVESQWGVFAPNPRSLARRLSGERRPGHERSVEAGGTMPRALISADSHVFEPLDLWETRLPKSLRNRGPKREIKDGRQLFFVDGKLWKFFIAFNNKMFEGKTFADFQAAMEGRYGTGAVEMRKNPDGSELPPKAPTPFVLFVFQNPTKESAKLDEKVFADTRFVLACRPVKLYAYSTAAYLLAGLGVGSLGLLLSIVLYGLAVFAVPSIMAAAVGDYLGLSRAATAFATVTVFFAAGQTIGPGSAGLIAGATGTISTVEPFGRLGSDEATVTVGGRSSRTSPRSIPRPVARSSTAARATTTTCATSA